MFRLFLLLLPLAVVCSAARPRDYSTDMVVLEDGQTVQTMKLYVSGSKSRVEGFTAGPLGKIVTIARKDLGVTWTLYLDKKQFTEKPLVAGGQSGKPDLANFDLSNLERRNLGRETVLGHSCTKTRVTMGNLPNNRPMTATVWVADDLELPLRLETMGIVQENRNLWVRPQPASLFEIPAGFTKSSGPGIAGRLRELADASGIPLPQQGYRGSQTASPDGPAWKVNTNYPGGDFRTIDMATSNPTACKAACDRDARCKAWTLVKPEAPGGMGYCWLKDSIPPETSEDCCISGLKGASGVASTQSTRYQLEMNVNRAGEDYRDFTPGRASAILCADACARESRCRSWTWVKNDLEPPTGHCWLKNRVPEPGPDDCCVSGVKR